MGEVNPIVILIFVLTMIVIIVGGTLALPDDENQL